MATVGDEILHLLRTHIMVASYSNNESREVTVSCACGHESEGILSDEPQGHEHGDDYWIHARHQATLIHLAVVKRMDDLIEMAAKTGRELRKNA